MPFTIDANFVSFSFARYWEWDSENLTEALFSRNYVFPLDQTWKKIPAQLFSRSITGKWNFYNNIIRYYSDYSLLQYLHTSYLGNFDSTNVMTAFIVNFEHFLAVWYIKEPGRRTAYQLYLTCVITPLQGL